MGIFMAAGVRFHRGRSSAGAAEGEPLTCATRRLLEAVAVAREREGWRRELAQRAQMKGVRGLAIVGAFGVVDEVQMAH